MKSITRRALLKYSTAIAGLAVFSLDSVAGILTPSASEGPFYPKSSMRFDDIDNDLVKVSNVVAEAGGEIILLTGQLVSREGASLAGHRIEIWQCDVNGKYLYPRDGRNILYDESFQGFGHDITDINGHYQFRTIKPTNYPGRAPHIHVKVWDGEHELLTTQLYIAGYKFNDSDGLYRRMSSEQAEQVSMVFNNHGDVLETIVDVII
ncbi:MAG: protocatechuate 3,4-dioxygenase beta subunit [Methylophagaceae bacterium]|jgi:protocatechuate 3,4-dioxygenase beta subunit